MAIVMGMTWERWDAALDLSDSKRRCYSAFSVPAHGTEDTATQKAVSECSPRPELGMAQCLPCMLVFATDD